MPSSQDQPHDAQESSDDPAEELSTDDKRKKKKRRRFGRGSRAGSMKSSGDERN
jgi:hypothetical protein